MNIFTFISDDGENINIDAEGLRIWCIANRPEVFNLPVKPELGRQFLFENVVSVERAWELIVRKNFDPIIMVKDGTYGDNGGPNTMLVDGHHRYFIACVAQWAYIPGHLLEVEQWKPFQMHGLPDLTKEELIAKPITKRNY
jgi:hypothetical protein